MDKLDEANKAKAAKLLQPYWPDVVALLGEDPTTDPRYRTLIQAVVVQGRPPRAVLEDMQHLRR